MKLLAIKLF